MSAEREWTQAQRNAINSEAKEIICVAGPGSGKTAVVVERIKRLIADGTKPWQIAAVTYTNAAARELEERLGVRLGHCGTLHSFCLRILRTYGTEAGYGDRTAILSPESAFELLKTKGSALGKFNDVDLVAAFAAGVPPTGTRLAPIQTAVALYRDELRSSGIVDLDSILTTTAELLPTLPFRLTFEHFFVDEVQDASPGDWKIFRALTISNKFFVGDPDQAIYGFRGGSVAEMISATNTPTATIFRLQENFRSGAMICSAAQLLIEKNLGRVSKRTVGTRTEPGTVVFAGAYGNEGEEVGAVARRIKSLLADKTEPTEIAVLARTNGIAMGFQRTFKAIGLPVVERSKPDLPPDWALVRAAATFAATPWNGTLAYFYLVARFGADSANKHKRSAAAASTGIASYIGWAHENAKNANMLAAILLSELGPTRESVMLLSEVLKGLPGVPTALDYALAINAAGAEAKESGEGIAVTTLHGAKGREFDVVFLVGFEDEVLPGKGTRDVEEERRLAYVGITRARFAVSVSWAETRVASWGGPNSILVNNPSRFIAEMGL